MSTLNRNIGLLAIGLVLIINSLRRRFVLTECRDLGFSFELFVLAWGPSARGLDQILTLHWLLESSDQSQLGGLLHLIHSLHFCVNFTLGFVMLPFLFSLYPVFSTDVDLYFCKLPQLLHQTRTGDWVAGRRAGIWEPCVAKPFLQTPDIFTGEFGFGPVSRTVQSGNSMWGEKLHVAWQDQSGGSWEKSFEDRWHIWLSGPRGLLGSFCPFPLTQKKQLSSHEV